MFISAITDWSTALADPRFWASRYGFDETFVALFGVSLEEWNRYYFHMVGSEDSPEDLDDPFSEEEGSTFTLAFPENFAWKMEIVSEGMFHSIYHPQWYPNDVFIAAECGCSQLPGLRWAELKQMVACLQHGWKELFDVRAVFPLLYPVVSWIAFDELNDVRETLHDAWETLHVLEFSNIDRLLDKTLQVYEDGNILDYDPSRGWYNQFAFPLPASGEPLWLYNPSLGWYTRVGSQRRKPELFTSFFSMLERYG